MGGGELLRRIRCAPASPTSQPGLTISAAWGFSRGQSAPPAWHGNILGTYIQISAFETPFLWPFHQGRMQRVITPHLHHARLSPAQPRFCVLTPEPMTWQRLARPFLFCGCCSLLGQGAMEQERVAVCSRLGPGTGPSLPCASTSLCSHSSLGLCPERHKGQQQQEDMEAGDPCCARMSVPRGDLTATKALPNLPIGPEPLLAASAEPSSKTTESLEPKGCLDVIPRSLNIHFL